MKDRLVIAFLLAFGSFVASAAATEFSFGVRASAVLPEGRSASGEGYYYGDVGAKAGVLGLDAGPGGGVCVLIAPWRFGEFELAGDYEVLTGAPSPAKGSIIPLRAGFNLKAGHGRYTLRCGGGAGYYVFKTTSVGVVFVYDNEGTLRSYDVWGKLDLSGPGFYYGFGVSLNFGKWSLDFTPRWNYIFNEGSYTGTAVDEYEGYELYFDLPYNCTYAEAALGVSYRVF